MNGFLSIYGACLLLAVYVGAKALRKGTADFGLRRGTCAALLALCAPLGVLGARVNYMLASPYGLMGGGFMSPYPFEYAACGAVLGCVLGGVLAALATRQSIGYTLDAITPAGLVFIALARAAETFADFGWGAVVQDEIIMRFPFCVPDLYGEWHLSVFYLEALLAVLVLVCVTGGRLRAPGVQFSLALTWWSMAQIMCEMLRSESISRGFVRVQQVECAVFAFALLLIWARRVRMPRKPLLCRVGVYLGCVAAIGFSQFAMDKLTDVIPQPASYALMALALIAMGATVQSAMKTRKAWIGRVIDIE